VAHDPFDRVFHSGEIGESGVNLYRTVGEDTRKPLVLAGIDESGLAYRVHHPLRGSGIHGWVVAVCQQVFLQANRLPLCAGVDFRKEVEDLGFSPLHRTLSRRAGLVARGDRYRSAPVCCERFPVSKVPSRNLGLTLFIWCCLGRSLLTRTARITRNNAADL